MLIPNQGGRSGTCSLLIEVTSVWSAPADAAEAAAAAAVADEKDSFRSLSRAASSACSSFRAVSRKPSERCSVGRGGVAGSHGRQTVKKAGLFSLPIGVDSSQDVADFASIMLVSSGAQTGWRLALSESSGGLPGKVRLSLLSAAAPGFRQNAC